MSRYVLLPCESKNLFVLVSCEDLNQTHIIELPEELYDMNIFNNVNNRNVANNLLYRICKSEISKKWKDLLRIETINVICDLMKL